MSGVVAETPTAGARSGGPDEVVLGAARTGPEREMIREWAGQNRPGAPVCFDADDLENAAFLNAEVSDASSLTSVDPLVVPVRVTWLPPSTGSTESPRAADLLAMIGPRRPPAPLQRRLASRWPHRAQIVEGEPARVSDLRRRFENEAAEDARFAPFVVRSGVLACERAERQVIGDHYKVPRLVVEQITASARFRRKTEELADRLGRGIEKVRDEAADRLNELATVQSPPAIDAFRAALAPMHVPAWDVHVDTETVEGLHELNRTAPLVFLPTHRSYADPLVLAEVLRSHGLPRNTMLGGNNMAFWPLGTLGKRAGVIFIRRSSGDDYVYRFALREYIAYLVSKRFNLEWYVEGGRSRTGKLRPPKMGLLSYLSGAIDEGMTPDVMMVPVSLVYDQMYEVDAMAAEQGGLGKSAEGLGWLAKYVRGQRRTSGNARVRFGVPFSLADALSEAGEDSKVRLEKVAFAISDGINKATPVTPTALVTFALLGTGGRALTLDQVRRAAEPLQDYLTRRGLPGPYTGELDGDGIRRTLDRLVGANVVSRFDGGAEQVWSIKEGHFRVAAFYRNGAVHHYVTRAIAELALLRASTIGTSPSGPAASGVSDPIDAVLSDALALRDLLKFEFFFPPKARFTDDVTDELELIDPDWLARMGSRRDAEELLRATRFLAAPRALRSFVDAQLVVAHCLVEHDPRQEIDRKKFTQGALGRGRQMLLQGRIQNADSVSTELYGSALDLAANRKLTERAQTSGAAAALNEARRIFRAEIEEVAGRIAELARVESDLTDEVLS